MYESLYPLAQEACNRHRNIQAAERYVQRKLDNDPKLKKALLKEMISSAIKEAIYDVRHHSQSRVKMIPQPCTRGVGAMGAIAVISQRILMEEWILPNGQRLGDGKGEYLDGLSIDEANRAAGHSVNAEFYEAIVARIGKGSKIVRKHLSAMDLDTMLDLAKKRNGIGIRAP